MSGKKIIRGLKEAVAYAKARRHAPVKPEWWGIKSPAGEIVAVDRSRPDAWDRLRDQGVSWPQNDHYRCVEVEVREIEK